VGLNRLWLILNETDASGDILKIELKFALNFEEINCAEIIKP
jgi:hypothetical protein